MRIRRLSARRKKARIEIVPMIDTIFFLLVFFMVATTSMTVTRGLPVNLPEAGTARKDNADRLTITITKDNRYYLDKQETAPEGLFRALKKDAADKPDVLVVINADSDVTHGRVVKVIDTVKLAGISRLAIATKPAQE